MNTPTIIVLCAVSALAGRLLLTTDQVLRTITVRIPALVALAWLLTWAFILWALFGLACFIGGSFYGLSKWWWPQLFEVLEGDGDLVLAIATGRWPQ